MNLHCVYRLLILILALSPIQAYAEITITNAYALIYPYTADRASVFLTIKNSDRNPIYLSGVSSHASHNSMLQQLEENDGAQILKTKNDLIILGNSMLQLRPGDIQITLNDLYTPQNIGSILKVDLTFSNGKTITVNAQVRDHKS